MFRGEVLVKGLEQEALDLLPFGMMFMDRDKRIVLMNRYAADRFSLKSDKDIFLQDVLQDLSMEPSDPKRSMQFKLGDEAFAAQRFPFFSTGSRGRRSIGFSAGVRVTGDRRGAGFL